MSKTVITFILDRLAEIGIGDIFGVPGDYAFAVNDAVIRHPDIRWVGCCNELNAAYAADGYARIRGVGALCTTYGVGELSALNGMAGAYAEHAPVFHIVGMPNTSTEARRSLSHHTLGNGEYGLFRRVSEPVVCAHTIITPQNAAYETERLIAEALYHQRPVYMGIPADVADAPLLSTTAPFPLPSSNAAHLDMAVTAILQALGQARQAVVLVDALVGRAGAVPALERFITASGLPFSALLMGKGILDERHPHYIGIYNGALMNEPVRERVEGADCVISVGGLMTDLNSGGFTARLPCARTITLHHHNVDVCGTVFTEVEIGDVLEALAARVAQREWPRLAPTALAPSAGSGDDAITAEALYPRWESFLKADDIVVTDIGTCSMGLGFALLPERVSYLSQNLWASIGWATPAALGAAMAAQRRVVLVTGEGAHQMTVQEISQFFRLGLKPIIFVLNNDGYLIERLLCRDPEAAYNDVAPWRYTELPHALGADGWLTARVTTCAELDAALYAAETHDTGVYIEVVTERHVAPPMAEKIHHALRAIYQNE